MRVAHDGCRESADEDVRRAGTGYQTGVTRLIQEASGWWHRRESQLMLTSDACTVQLPDALMLMAPDAVMSTPLVLIVTVFPATVSVILSGAMTTLVVATCSVIFVGVMAEMPFVSRATVWCGPVGDAGIGIGSGELASVWIVIDAGFSVNAIWLPAFVRMT